MKFHVSQLRFPHLWPASVFGCEKGTLCQEFTMYWKQESVENEVAIIRAASKGQGFVYRAGAIQLEEKGPFSSVITERCRSKGQAASALAAVVRSQRVVFTKISHFWED